MSISRTSATALTNALTDIKTHKQGLAAARARYKEAFDAEFRAAVLRPGHDELTLELQMGPMLVDRLLAAFTVDDREVQRLIERIDAVKTPAAA